MPDYLRDPRAITRRSFELVAAAVDLGRFPEGLRPLVTRLVHSTGMPEIAAGLVWRGQPWSAAASAFAAARPVLVDARMVAAGIAEDRLPQGVDLVCTLDDPRTPGLATGLATTRSAAAVELWRERLPGAVVAIGNAPTALFHLLERLRHWSCRPAVILAFPVGFVGAAESKAALIAADLDIPFVTLPGRLGGSAMAAAAVNALIVHPGGGADERA